MKSLYLLVRILFFCFLIIVSVDCYSLERDESAFLVTSSIGDYPDTSTYLGGNITVNPVSVPTDVTFLDVSASSGFLGIITVDPISGVVSITDANPIGTYTITVSSGPGLSQSFSLTVNNYNLSCGQFGYGSPTNSTTNGIPRAVVAGDFDGDGFQDLAICSETGNSVSIRKGNGSGGFNNIATIGVGTSPYSIAIGDFNKDGKQDLATANRGSSNVSILLGNGSGSFNLYGNFLVDIGPYFIVVGDFNNDRNQDLATANYSAGNISILFGNGHGGFSSPTTFLGGTTPSYIATRDFNNDGNLDLAVTNFSYTSVLILLGNGTGTFSSNGTVTVGSGPYSIAMQDINSDGNLDMAVANFASNTLSIRFGNGLGGFNGSTNLNAGSGSLFVVIRDFNADSKQDLVVANLVGNTLDFFTGDGLGSFSLNNTIATGGNGPVMITSGDFNNDHRADFAVVNINTNQLSIFTGSGSDIDLRANNISIPDGSTTISSAINTDFGSLNTCSTTFSRTYTIQNTGSANLTINSIFSSGNNTSDFVVSGIVLPATVFANQSVTFTVTFGPSSIGTKTATIHINNNDCDEADYDFAVQGTVVSNDPPVFTSCPGNSNPTAPNGFCRVVANYLASATSTSTYSYSFTGATVGNGAGTGTGSNFNEGITHVTVTATNPCGSANCNFDISVTANTDDNNNCTTDGCNTQTGVISHTSFNIADSDSCTIDACNTVSGQITHQPINTNDNDECTVDGCNSLTGVFHTLINTSDGDACTVDGCNSLDGTATHVPINTDDGNQCTIDGCISTTGVFHTPVNTDDGDPCTNDGCNSSTGIFHTPKIINASSNSPICNGDTLKFFASGGANYSWIGPNGFSSTQQNPSIPNFSSTNSGNYTVTVNDSGNLWTKKASFNKREGAVSFSIGSKGYMGTGFLGFDIKNDFWEYDPLLNLWTQKANFGGPPREFAVGFSIGNKGYIGTGSNIVIFFNDFWEYDPITNSWSSKNNFGGSPRVQAIGFSINSKGYIGMGRFGNNAIDKSNDLWEYNPANDSWIQKTSLGAILTDGRDAAVAFSIGSKGYVGTGSNKIAPIKDFWEYNPVLDSWTQKNDFGGIERVGAVGFSIGNRGYIGTGQDVDGNFYNDFWEYNPDTDSWIKSTNYGGSPVCFGTGFSIGDKGYIGTGIKSGNDVTDEFWQYKLVGLCISSVTISVNTFPGTLDDNNSCTIDGCNSLTGIFHNSIQTQIDTGFCESFILPWDGTVTTAGDYSHTYITELGCDSTVTIHLVLNPNTQATASSNSPVFVGGNIGLSASTGSVFQWSGPNNFTSSFQFPVITNASLANAGDYTVVVTNFYGCTSSASTSVNVVPNQGPDTSSNCYIKNITYVDCKTIEFEVWIEKTGNLPQKFQFFTAGIDFNYAGLANGGTITGAFVSGSANPSLPSSQQNPNWNVNQTSKQIRLLAAIATPEPSAAVLPPPPGFRIGKFRLRNSADFTVGITPNFVFKFLIGTATVTQTKVGYYLNGSTIGADCTHSATFIVEGNPPFSCTCVIVATIDQLTKPKCFGLSNGSVRVALSGGGSASSGTYILDGSSPVSFSSNPFVVSGLSAGIHTITASTSFPCTSNTVQFTIADGDLVDDNNPCTVDACNTLSGVSHTPININDGTVCTVDACNSLSGEITHQTLNTDDNNGCTIDGCNSSTGVFHMPVNTNDNNACTVDACNTSDGTVTHVPINTDDNNLCTIDACNTISGVSHTPVNVNDEDVCTTDACNSITGQITHQPLNTNDNNSCTVDGCNSISGIFHTPVNTNDGDACTVDGCNTSNGIISHTLINTDDGNLCTTDGCNSITGVFHTPINVDDGIACTVDVCNSLIGVIHNPIITQIDTSACASYTLPWNGPVNSTGDYSHTYTSASGCDSLVIIHLTIHSNPVATANSNSPVNVGGTISLTGSSGSFYQWGGPNNFTSSQQNPSITNVSFANAGTYTVVVTNSFGCSASASTSVVVQVVQGPDTSTNCYIKNITYVDCKTLEFDLWIDYTGNIPQKFTYFQAGIDFNYAGMANGGTITGAFVAGTADPSLPSSQQAPNWQVNQASKQIRFLAQIATPSSTAAVVPTPPGFRLGKFRLKNTVDFTIGSVPNFIFRYIVGTSTTTQTKIGLYLNGTNTSIDVTHASHQIVESNPPSNCGIACTVVASLEQFTNPTCIGVNNGIASFGISGGVASSIGTYSLDGSPNVSYSSNPFIISGLSAGTHSLSLITSASCTSNTFQFTIEAGSNPNDNNVCTIDFCNSSNGVVTHTQLNTDDGNQCTTDGCNSTTGVFNTPININDLDVCTIDACNTQSGTISHAPVNTDDGNACTTDGCNSTTGIFHTPVNPDDGNVCTIDFCNTSNGQVSHTFVDISDGNECTVDGCHSVTGVFHNPVNFDDNNLCTIDACDPISGISHTPVIVDDNNLCTADACDPLTGVSHSGINFDDHNACTIDDCDPLKGESHQLINIDDNNVCTIDVCDPITGISHTPINIDDNNVCTVDDCNSITGISNILIEIDDHDACTIDACDPVTGISHTPIIIDDNDACTIDACNSLTGEITHIEEIPVVIITPLPIQCYGLTTCITVTAFGGLPPYSGTGTFCGYPAGTHTFEVSDSKGCIVSPPSIIITEPEKLSASVTVTPVYLSNDGTATVFAEGGTPDYSYEWSPGGQTTSVATGLTAGNYCAQVTDANGCTATACGNVYYADVCDLSAPLVFGPSGVCKKQTGIVFCTTYNPAASSYVWTLPPGVSFVGTSNGPCITLKFTSKFKGGFICVKETLWCGTTANGCINVVLITKKPITPGIISGPPSLCPNQAATFSIAAVPNSSSYIWKVDGHMSILSGQGTTSVTVQTAADFNGGHVKVQAKNCIDHSGTKTLNVTKNVGCKVSNNVVADKKEIVADKFSVYPNPTSGILTVSLQTKTNSAITLKLVDILGNIVRRDFILTDANTNTKDFDLSNLPRGMYFMIVENEGVDVQSMRVIVN